MPRLLVILLLLLAASAFAATTQKLSDLPLTTTLRDSSRIYLFDTMSGNRNMTGSALKNAIAVAAGGLVDAPSDGSTYGRKNAAWVAVTTGGGGVSQTAFNSFSTATQTKLNQKAPATSGTALLKGNGAGGFSSYAGSSCAGATHVIGINASGAVSCDTTGGYETIMDEGAELNQWQKLNFTGAGITCSNDAVNERTNCAVPSTKDTTAVTGILYGNGSTVAAAVAGNFPTLNQNTTGTAAGLAAAYIDWSAGSGGASILNKPTLGTAAAQNSTAFEAAGAVSTHAALTTGVHGSGANSLIYSNDSRLTDARTPTAHNQAETTITFTDVTTGNASVSNHGYLPKLTGSTANFLRADGSWSAPTASAAWGGITGTLSNQTDLQSALDAKAALASPTFSGTPSLPTGTTGITQSNNDNSTKLATTAYVNTNIGTVYRVSGSDFTTSSTTAGTVTGLTWSIGANASQSFDCILNTTNTATSLLRFGVNQSTTPTAIGVAYSYRSTAYGTEIINAAGAVTATATTAAVTASVLTTPIIFRIYGSIKNGANAGTVSLHATASTSGQTGTVRVGSYCIVY